MKIIDLYGGLSCLVDDEDYFELSKVTWTPVKRGSKSVSNYAVNKKLGYMHRLITNCPKDFVVDHRDGNGLNNQKSNLRVCTQRENVWNSRSKGVHYNKINKNWRAQIRKDGKVTCLGSYKTEQEAIYAREEAKLQWFGEFARLNKKAG